MTNAPLRSEKAKRRRSRWRERYYSEPAYRERLRTYWRKRYARLRAAGSCVRCGAAAQKDRIRCRPCGQQSTKEQLARVARKKGTQ